MDNDAMISVLKETVGLSVDSARALIAKLGATSLKLLYDSKQHEKTNAEFHNLVDRQGHTLTFIIKENKICCGVAFSEWRPSGWIEDGQAFLCIFTDPVRYYHIQKEIKQKALYYNSECGPTFGADVYTEFSASSRTGMFAGVFTAKASYNLPLDEGLFFTEKDKIKQFCNKKESLFKNSVDRICTFSFTTAQ